MILGAVLAAAPYIFLWRPGCAKRKCFCGVLPPIYPGLYCFSSRKFSVSTRSVDQDNYQTAARPPGLHLSRCFIVATRIFHPPNHTANLFTVTFNAY
ncbi:hypothetical protein C8F04DRAFT_687514 [Mycena alexandri]|uniref:Secreted protein n=1 Tax=Mycena alexandri TaxID=1745969 RepID=A0AAD6XD72_9AGAR|nr:hypothetical protein C8F04DRAFT_687514 [Mycena alexandri]